MNAPDRQRAIEVFESALDHEPADRDAYLDGVCRGNPELRAEVESLLEADERACGFLEPPEHVASQTASDSDPLIGTTVGRYHITRVIAAGGMGTVYEAVQEEPRRTVALKVIRAGMTSRSALQRFKHESEILGRLPHPGIAQIYEAGTHGGDHGPPFFAMEYVPGARSITQHAKDQRLSTRQRLELFVKVCDAVQAGHRRGVIHRDLKPANILVDENGQPKLIDFGVARATDADLTIAMLQTDVGQLVGTLRYMSPEQCEGDAIEIDTRSDVYALGVVLFELLTGELPYDFSTASPFDVPRVIREQEPRRMSAVNRMLRGDIETIVLKALEKDRVHRYQSVPELLRDIQHYLQHEPIEAKRGRRWYVFQKTLRRHRVAFSVGAAFMLMVVASALGFALMYHDSEQQRITAEQRAEELRHAVYLNDITLAHRAYEAGDGVELSRRLSNCPTDLRGWEWHYLKRLSDTSLKTLTAHTDAINALAVSPDGRLIASGSCDRTLHLWDRSSGRRVHTFRTKGYVDQVSISPGSKLIACAGRKSSHTYVWDVATGEPVERLVVRSNFAVAFSPDGKYIAGGGFAYEPLRIWDVATGELRREWPDTIRSRPMNIAWSPDSRMLATARSDGTVVLLDVASGRTVQTFSGHRADVKRVAFSPGGQHLASTSFDNTLRVWRLDSKVPERVLAAKSELVSPVTFSPDGTRVATGCASALRVWNIGNGSQEATRLGHSDFVGAVAFTPDGHRIVTASHDGTVKVWDASPLTEPLILATSDCEYAAVAVSPLGDRVAVGDVAGHIRLLDMPSGVETASIQAHEGSIWAVAFDHADGRLATTGADGYVRIFNAPFDSSEASLPTPGTAVRALAWSPDDEQIALGHTDGVVRVWDVAAGEIMQTIDAHEGTVFSVTFSPDGTRLITAGDGTGARVWNAESGDHIRDLPTDANRNVAAISPSGGLVAAGTDDHDLWVWDVETGTPLWKAEGHLGTVMDIEFLPGEPRIVTCGYHGLIRIWDTETGDPTLTLRGHDSGVRDLAISPDGRWFVSAGLDKTVRFWDARLSLDDER
jgi:WD40 repeat protein/serine/threonine-protein kinase RIO1